MLQKHYSTAIIGQSYLSLIYGLELLRQGHSVLLLDDDRLHYGDLFNHGLGSLDIEFLKTWGNDREIECLSNIEEFLHPRPYTLHWNKVRIQLGQSPYENILELFRKLPDIFPFQELFHQDLKRLAAKINEEYLLLTQRLGANGFRFKSLENLNYDYFLGQCPETIKDLFKLFKWVVDKSGPEELGFLYFSRIPIHKRLTLSCSSAELFHYFLMLIGPQYSLPKKSLLEKLVQNFMDNGGHFKKTQVREWKFYKSLPWSMELASFEGIIHPQKISFLGALPKGLPLKVDDKVAKFTCIHFEVDVTDARLEEMEGEWHFWGDDNKLGTDLPFWSLQIVEGKVYGQYLYREKPGSKLEFYEELIKKFLTLELDAWLIGLGDKINQIRLNTGREIYLDQNYKFTSSPLPRLKEVRLFDYSDPVIHKKLKNVSYFGPLKGCPLGLFGQLLELKEIPKYQ